MSEKPVIAQTFVSYSHSNGQSHGFGNCTILSVIREPDDVPRAQEAIQRDTGLKGVVLISWQEFPS